MPLEARLSTNSCSTRRRPGKLSNVRSSRNSSSRNVAGSPAAGAGAGEEGERRVEGAARAGRRAFADRKRRRSPPPRAETVRASSPCARRRCTAPTCGRGDRAAAAAAWCGRCRIRRGAPESATATRRARQRCGVSECNEASAFAVPQRERCARRRKTDIKKRRARCQIENENIFYLTRAPSRVRDRARSIAAAIARHESFASRIVGRYESGSARRAVGRRRQRQDRRSADAAFLESSRGIRAGTTPAIPSTSTARSSSCG